MDGLMKMELPQRMNKISGSVRTNENAKDVDFWSEMVFVIFLL